MKFPAGAIVALLAAMTVPAAADPDAFFQAKDWVNAARAYEEVVADNANDALAWYRLGMSRHQLEQYPQAVVAYEKAAALGSTQRGLKYDLACVYSRMNRTDDAFRALDQAVASGFGDTAMLDGDPDFANLRADPRYKKLLASIEQTVRPCNADPKARQFDFWVGDWEVFTPDGQRAGSNLIQSVEEGCMLLENWTGTGGDSGRSINYYDAIDGRWQQDWVSSRGGIIHYTGGLADGAMKLTGESRTRTGRKGMVRGTWTPLPDGRVRQLGEGSADGGRTWQVNYDLYYVRKPTR